MLSNIGSAPDPFATAIGFKSKLGIVLGSWIAIAVCGFTGYAMQGQDTLDGPSSNTIYTFQLSMNGHNAATIEQEMNNYAVPLGHLTPQGIRQKYLLGKYNRFKADQVFGYDRTITDWAGSKYEDLYVRSTRNPRAIASAYAELLGFTNDGEIHAGLQLSAAQVANIDTEERQFVPFKTRRS